MKAWMLLMVFFVSCSQVSLPSPPLGQGHSPGVLDNLGINGGPTERAGPNALGKGSTDEGKYPWHPGIMTTLFWIGEEASDENGFIHNEDSVYDRRWMERFGGYDDPDDRDGYFPSDFVPKENPFYAAIPYADLGHNGLKDSARRIPWSGPAGRSLIKNRWIEVRYSETSCYAQIEDAGPYGEDDADYVFGTSPPSSDENDGAGLDVSPAMRDCLDLSANGVSSWRFVDDDDVPEGPWKKIVTRS